MKKEIAQSFIFVHDQQIILDYIQHKKFEQLPNLKYVFLGDKPVNQIEHLDGVIVARNLPDNIEHFPNLTAWSGWYAVSRNKLINSEIVNLFEYDVNLKNWSQPITSSAYISWPADLTWWDYNNIKPELIKLNMIVSEDKLLPVTSNYSLDEDKIHTFINELMSSGIDYNHQQAGHIVERYCGAHFQNKVVFANGLTHIQADSHGTQGYGKGYKVIKVKLL
jgi:hypothetical protein